MGVFSHTRFRWLAAARTTGYLGNAVAPLALAFAVLDLTGSVTDLGLVVGARSIANILLLLAGGVLADRLPRAWLLQGSSLAAAATTALLAVSVLAGFASVPLLAVIGLLNGAAAAIALPASASITPETVPADLLQPANAILRIGTNSAAVVGASAGGLLVRPLVLAGRWSRWRACSSSRPPATSASAATGWLDQVPACSPTSATAGRSSCRGAGCGSWCCSS
jgi:MFS family permease